MSDLFEANMQAVAWFKQQYDLGNLQLKPPYQRKPVWTSRNKCAVIETILMGWPVPEIYIQGIPSESGNMTYAVVDGQQRTRSVLQFIGLEKDPEESEWNGFPLDKIPQDSRFYGTKFSEMTDDQKKAFFGYRFTVRWIYTDDDELVRNMFAKLNMFSMPLKAQELRNAMFQGPFLKLSEQLADDDYWATKRIISPAGIRRMGDVEFMSDLLIGLIHGPQGGAPKILDEYYRRYEDYDDEFPEQAVVRELFSRVLETIRTLLPDIDDTRWHNKNDFYSLFVTLGARLRSAILPPENVADIEAALVAFGEEVDKLRDDENANVEEGVKNYFAAVEKGANDKSRRGDRHLILENLLKPEWFAPKKKATAVRTPNQNDGIQGKVPPAKAATKPATPPRGSTKAKAKPSPSQKAKGKKK